MTVGPVREMCGWDDEMKRLATIVRWTARVWSIPSIVALLLPYFVEGLYWLQATSIREVIGHLCFLAVLVGLLLAWRWEGLGGGLTVTGMMVFYITWWLYGKTPRGPFFVLIAAPGCLFLLSWWLLKQAQEKPQSAEREGVT
jgi:hypothetical protein